MKIAQVILPKNLNILTTVGEQIKLARIRRKLSTEQVSERAGIGRMTLYKMENGSPTVAMGSFLQVLFILGLQKDLTKIASDDTLGRKLQDAGMITKKRAPKTNEK
jgi:transcriptional regulator with XRE-family HTH domain